ncbi:peroxide stress protein YaaA [Burkholderia sp. L27(2015)]|uniref:peroxide stress protein YaaA n=1 Tax=Burkholderia sp. L27(2015) TaxID=1641858 RepID=UPI00131DFFAA|nr:peroxide stress protein YaaA [Burkholderia sp. L27(2015)]
MIIVLSPAKSLDYQTPAPVARHTLPAFVADSAELIASLRDLSPPQIASLMKISDPLAQLNFERYASWIEQFDTSNSKQAIFAFNGDVYEGLDAASLPAPALKYAQSHIRILSGLYGLLRPLDLMQPYRLEMGTRFQNARGRDLYGFWGDRITHALNDALSNMGGARKLVNLASEEYFKSVKPKGLTVPVVTPVFEDWKNGRYKIISFYAKRARGLMARYAALHGVTDAEQLKSFDSDGYTFEPDISGPATWVFRRRLAA